MFKKIKNLLNKNNKLEERIKRLEEMTESLSDIMRLFSKEIDEYINKEPKIPVPYWLEDGARLPERKKEGDIGYDAYLNEDKVIKAHSAEKVSLGIGMKSI